ncbi:MAG: hypothetical protein V9F03_07590 [Microthrixaceae bacterium]
MGGLIRAVMALALGVLGGLLVRLIGGPANEPEQGGWRPLEGAELR